MTSQTHPQEVPELVELMGEVRSRIIEAMREDPFMDDIRYLGTTTQDQRMAHYADIALAALQQSRSTPGAGDFGWIVTDGKHEGERYRTWESGEPEWTVYRDKATRYARREDAEAVHREDEDAWRVVPYALAASPVSVDASGALRGALTKAIARLNYLGDDDRELLIEADKALHAAPAAGENPHAD